MCIFNFPVFGVSQTSILVSVTQDKRQLVVYENVVPKDHISGQKYNAMILPFPYQKGDKPITLIDSEKCASNQISDLKRNLFDDLKRFYPGARRIRDIEPEEEATWSDNYLEVHHVGGYSVSIAYSLEETRRINPEVFKLRNDIDKLLSHHYGMGFGFIIAAFSIQEGIDYHPIGYIHDLSHDRTTLFVPTRHEHGVTKEKEDFSHDIYVSNPIRGKLKEKYGQRVVGTTKKSDRAMRRVLEKYGLSNILPVDSEISLVQMYGLFENTDQEVEF